MALRHNNSNHPENSNVAPGLSRFADGPALMLLRYSVVLLLIVTGLFHFRAAFFAQLSQNQGRHMASFSNSLTNPDALAHLARNEHLRNANLPAALVFYKKALTHFVLHLPSWFGLAEVLNDQGKEKEAVDALEFIHANFTNSEDIAWSKTLLASTLGQEEILTENLIWLAQNRPARKKEAVSLAILAWDSPDMLMDKFGKDFYVDILLEYINNDAFEKTIAVWKRMVSSNAVQQKAAVRYVDYLMGQNAFLLAEKVWKTAMDDDESLLYNGNFENPIQGSGFGWRIPKTKGVTWKQGEYGSGLEITFDGTDNAYFQLAQVLPLKPGKYILSGFLETDDLTTDQRPFWRIQGVQCDGLNEQSEMALPNQHATDFILPFVVPDNCELIRIALIRKTSLHFDNKIAGKVTVSNLRILPGETRSPSPAKSFAAGVDEKAGKENSPEKTETTFSFDKLVIKP